MNCQRGKRKEERSGLEMEDFPPQHFWPKSAITVLLRVSCILSLFPAQLHAGKGSGVY